MIEKERQCGREEIYTHMVCLCMCACLCQGERERVVNPCPNPVINENNNTEPKPLGEFREEGDGEKKIIRVGGGEGRNSKTSIPTPRPLHLFRVERST